VNSRNVFAKITAKIRSIISKRQAGKVNQTPNLSMRNGVSIAANHQENHIWQVSEQQKYIKKHKRGVYNHDYLKESSRN